MPLPRLLPLLLAAAALVALAFSDPAAATTRTYTAAADAYVDAGRPHENYGKTKLLRLGRRPARRTYVRFLVRDTGAAFQSATLLLYVKRGSARGLQIRRVANQWRESSITWRRQPRVSGRAIFRKAPARSGKWTSVDISSMVRRAGRYSFRITSETKDLVLRSSGSHGPRLKIKPVPPANVTPPQALGTAEEGGRLSVDPGTWSGSTPMGFAYQWERCAEGTCAEVDGATTGSYSLGPADEGSKMRVTVLASNAAGSASAFSPDTAIVVPPSDPPTVTISSAPSISTTSTSAKFSWTTSGTVAATECQLDLGPFDDCGSPSSYGSLGVGAHTFTVRVSNAAGSSTDTASWTVANVVVWSADHETGDASQWSEGITSRADDAGCIVHAVVPYAQAIGSYAMKMTIDRSGQTGGVGCRQAQRPEAQSGNTYVYEASYYLPQRVNTLNNMFNVFQFKSLCSGCPLPDPMWTIGFEGNSGDLHVTLNWKGGNYGLAGPFSNSGVAANQEWRSASVVPFGRWTELEVLLDQSSGYDGHITVWHDGVKLFDFANVRTEYASGDLRWLVGNYSNGLTVNPYTLYIDDASIAKP